MNGRTALARRYRTELMPLLAEWTELWLRAHGAARGIADHHMRAYLVRGTGAAEAARIIEKEAEDDSLKMINLARDWLTALVPHIMSKINRVSYGLLSAKDVVGTGASLHSVLIHGSKGVWCKTR